MADIVTQHTLSRDWVADSFQQLSDRLLKAIRNNLKKPAKANLDSIEIKDAANELRQLGIPGFDSVSVAQAATLTRGAERFFMRVIVEDEGAFWLFPKEINRNRDTVVGQVAIKTCSDNKKGICGLVAEDRGIAFIGYQVRFDKNSKSFVADPRVVDTLPLGVCLLKKGKVQFDEIPGFVFYAYEPVKVEELIDKRSLKLGHTNPNDEIHWNESYRKLVCEDPNFDGDLNKVYLQGSQF